MSKNTPTEFQDASSLPTAGQAPPLPLGETLNDLPKSWSYEATVASIETIIDRIETGDMELADIFDQFAIAVEHLHQCESFLNHHRQQVDLLIETLTDDPRDQGSSGSQ